MGSLVRKAAQVRKAHQCCASYTSSNPASAINPSRRQPGLPPPLRLRRTSGKLRSPVHTPSAFGSSILEDPGCNPSSVWTDFTGLTPARQSKMYLQYYINEKGDKVYTTKVIWVFA